MRSITCELFRRPLYYDASALSITVQDASGGRTGSRVISAMLGPRRFERV